MKQKYYKRDKPKLNEKSLHLNENKFKLCEGVKNKQKSSKFK